MIPERGSIVWVDLSGGQGSEQDKTRPAIVVSNDGANTSAWSSQRGVITLVPLTSKSKRPYPFQALIRSSDSGLPRDSIAQGEQVRSVDVRRIRATGTSLPLAVMADVERALQVHLALW